MNNIENPNFSNKVDKGDEKERYNKTGLENLLQIELASRIYDGKNDESMKKWVSNEAKIFRDYIENHPGYLVQYKDALGGDGNVDEIVEKIEEDILNLEKEIKPEI